MAKFVLDRRAIDKLAKGSAMQATLLVRAETIAREARRIARSEAYDSGDYHDGIDATSGVERGHAIGRVNADDWKSHFIEFGTSSQPTKAVLRRAAEVGGLRVDRGGKR